MKRDGGAPKNDRSELIGEMMLAKTVLEEKNEILDRKDDLIRELKSHERELDSELSQMREQLEAAAARSEEECATAYRRGVQKVAEEVAQLAIDSEGEELLPRLIRLLERDYGLEIVDQVALPIDPRAHRVIDVVQSSETNPRAEVLAKGIILNGIQVRPALVRIFQPAGSLHTTGQV